MYFVYILENLDGKLYIGQTNCVEERLARHNSRRKNYTSDKGPWKVIYTEEYKSRSEAMQRERYLKSLKNSKYIRDNIIK